MKRGAAFAGPPSNFSGVWDYSTKTWETAFFMAFEVTVAPETASTPRTSLAEESPMNFERNDSSRHRVP